VLVCVIVLDPDVGVAVRVDMLLWSGIDMS
jgi:hypothetical protein